MLTFQPTDDDDLMIDHAREITAHTGHAVDPVLGFARVIVNVNKNTKHFRGWGP